MQPNNFIQTLKPYIPISHKVWEIPNKQKILKLDWNESSIPPSPQVISALINAIENDNLHWYPNTRNKKLLKLLGEYVGFSDKHVEIFASSDCAHEFILQVFAMPYDDICIVAPTYDNFRSRAEGIGLKIHFFYTQDNGNLNFTELDYFLTLQKPKILYICNPNNPTGILHDVDLLKQLIIKHNHILFIIDEAYYEFCGVSLTYLLSYVNNLIITRTFSKAFGLASFRIGYCISTPQNITTLNLLRNAKSVAHLAQVAAFAALRDKAYMASYVKEVILARQDFIMALDSMENFKVYPSHANFVFVAHDNIAKLRLFLENQNIFIRDYSHIVAKHCRISIGTRKQMQDVVKTIKEFINQYNILGGN